VTASGIAGAGPVLSLPKALVDAVLLRVERASATRELSSPRRPTLAPANALGLHRRGCWPEPAPAFRAPLESLSARHRWPQTLAQPSSSRDHPCITRATRLRIASAAHPRRRCAGSRCSGDSVELALRYTGGDSRPGELGAKTEALVRREIASRVVDIKARSDGPSAIRASSLKFLTSSSCPLCDSQLTANS
jgi:hypothetical protein